MSISQYSTRYSDVRLLHGVSLSLPTPVSTGELATSKFLLNLGKWVKCRSLKKKKTKRDQNSSDVLLDAPTLEKTWSSALRSALPVQTCAAYVHCTFFTSFCFYLVSFSCGVLHESLRVGLGLSNKVPAGLSPCSVNHFNVITFPSTAEHLSSYCIYLQNRS